MNIQLILTYLIIIYAIAYTCYHLVQMILKQRKSACADGGCGGCDFKNELKRKGIQPISINKNEKFTYVKN